MTVWKEPADVATTEALGAGPAFPAFSGVIDGVTLKVGNRVLVKDQLTSTENGYYKVVAVVPPTLMATGDPIEAEDVIRVSRGDRNTHTAWALIDATNRIFIRQDVKHYSFDSIAALKLFWQALPNATATVANYDAARDDKGGGDFTFIGVPADGSATIAAAVATRVSVTAVTVASGVVTVTAAGHGLAAGSVASVFLGGPMTPSGAFFVVVPQDVNKAVNTFDVVDASTGSWAAGAYLSFVTITTSAPHGRVRGERIAVAGVSAGPGAINLVWDSAGIIDDTTLTIPVDTITGSYTVGANAVIGDDALVVAATDPTGAMGGLWKRTVASPIDVRWFGAFPNFDPNSNPTMLMGRANVLAFNAALAAGGGRGGRLVADGWFYLSNTLHIRKAIVFEGTGRNAPTAPGLRSAPGTWLVFPENVTGIQLHTGLEAAGAADETVLRNLTIWCKYARDGLGPDPGQLGYGIWINCPAYCEHVYVENFGAHGIFVDAGKPPAHPGNAGGFLLTKCTAAGCGGDGIHIQGLDATVGLITSCSAEMNYGYGFYDSTPAGTCYLACHGAFNTGYSGDIGLSKDYKTDSVSNSSLYLNCYSEGGENEVAGAALVIGGVLSQAPYNPNPAKACMIGPSGALFGNPLWYLNTSGPVHTQIEFGQQEGDDPPHGGVLNFFLPDRADPNVIRYDSTTGWWGLDNSGAHDRTSFRFPTTISAPRRVAPLFEHGIFYGTPSLLTDVGASQALINHIARTEIPTDGTWEVGDVVWNTAPVAGGPIGWVCTTAGTEDAALVGVTGNVDAIDGTLLTIDVLPGSLAKWQYITIAGVAGVYQIVNDPGHPAPDPALTVRINPAAPVGAGPGAVDFRRTAFSTFGPVENVGVSTSYGAADSPHALQPSERYVTVTSDATMTLPASPVDGQTYDIKSQAGITTTVDPNGNTIDGQNSVTLARGDNGTFRYSAATGEWELR